ncbi:hypothetical protein LQR31_22020 [Chromobacterium vaccinii]|uniref:hypothetical protein n=1 Tax=Chromobacterium vaccinii TaxID=1108595 RepID=UPI001E3B5FB2|nr:hypothetical protein [Chromobacterium vaccinii]MCD4487151.1 hypothetical protein [Chromobacterium vaccinii]
MKTDNLVNGYVLTNLFYELMFLEEYEVDGADEDWSNPDFTDELIRQFVSPRYLSMGQEAKVVVRNTLRFLLATESDGSERLDVIWQACSAPIPTPQGVRSFMSKVSDVLFPGEKPLSEEEISNFRVNHDMQIANRLN